MAAIDPFDEPLEESEKQLATLYMVRDPIWRHVDDDESIDSEDLEGLGMDIDDMMSEDDDEEANGGPSDPAKAALRKALAQDEEDSDDEKLDGEVNGKVNKGKGKVLDVDYFDDDDSDDSSEEGFADEVVLCTLDPNEVRTLLFNMVPIRLN